MAEEHSFHCITPEEIRALGAYEIIENRYLKDLGSEAYLLRHRKTGARLALLPNSDSNKVFYIAFRTPPTDSTGVAHIIEHTVLCGSRSFPVKDPFIEVVKGSLNTFLNAMTYPDKTVYPVASTNSKDFANLMHVYLDAVFYPNIYKEQNIFRQEGWHYEALPHPSSDGLREVIDEDSRITVNGVVYNEMKGALSQPEEILNDKVLASLYPDTTYSIVSGGDPQFIPDLSYEEYLDFHRRYYHPSNAYLYLYGDMDMAERLAFIDREYLSAFESLEIDSAVQEQAPFTKTREYEYPYSVMSEEEIQDGTFLSLNFSIPSGEDPHLNLAFRVLDYVLCDREGAPVKEALRRKGIGQDVASLYESGILQPYYSIVAKYANASQKQEFLDTIHETLEKIAEEGIDEKALLAGINYYEFRYREADFGSYPKGLIYGLDALDTWLYDDLRAWQNLEIGVLFEQLKKEVSEHYFEGLIHSMLLDNAHRSIVLLTPEPGLTEKTDAAMTEKMAKFAESLTAEERRKIAEETIALKKWQEMPDSEEALLSIPMLGREDLRKNALLTKNTFEETQDGIRILSHPVFTSNIDYMNFVFEIGGISQRLLKYLCIYKTLLGALSTQHYSYEELDNEINIFTGGLYPSIGTYVNASSPTEYRMTFEVSVKAMHENAKKAMELVSEMILRTDFSDRERILEILEEERAAMKAEMPAAGHATAMTRALSYISETYALLDEISGVSAYQTLDGVCDMLGSEDGEGSSFEQFKALMEEITSYIFCKQRLIFDITAVEESKNSLLPAVRAFTQQLYENVPDTSEAAYHPALTKKNEGFLTAGQVNYVCMAGNFLHRGYPFTGALRVLKVIMGYDYLWNRIRVKGGAYGCMSGYGRDGNAYFVTYRDPHLNSSLETFRQAGEYIRSFQADERTMTKYVIGAVSAMDRPLSPNLYGRYSMSGYFMNLSDEQIQRERDQVLNVKVEDIRALGDLIDAFIADGCLCVVGSSEQIRENKELFGDICQLV